MISTHVRIALASLGSTRFRTLLTTLGVVIGVMSITLVLALGEGAKQAVSQHVEAFDDDILIVRPGQSQRKSNDIIEYNPLTAYAATTLTEDDLRSVQNLEHASSVAPIMLVNGSVKNREVTSEVFTPIVATSPDLKDSLKLEMREGQFLDGTTARDTVVIGEQLSVDLFGTTQSLGHRVQIRGVDHVVIGVLRTIENPLGMNGVNYNNAALVSIEAGKGFNQGIAQIQQLAVQATSPEKTSELQQTIHKTLLANHSGEEDFTVMTSAEAVQISQDNFQILVSMIAAIASVSLLVGGIGIMNIMLVSVTERTHEIGIRKSLGASNGHIMAQFLIEALVMSLLGGIIGFALAYGLAWIASIHLAFQPVFEWYILGIALGLSVVVGTLFGLFPATRAALKDPIAALRQQQ